MKSNCLLGALAIRRRLGGKLDWRPGWRRGGFEGYIKRTRAKYVKSWYNIREHNQPRKNMTFHLIWHSQYGVEEIDSFTTRQEAEAMKVEYQLAFGEGHITIKARR